MKRGKLEVSKFADDEFDMSTNNDEIDLAKAFAGLYDVVAPTDITESDTPDVAAMKQLRFIHDMLLFCDKNPPKTGGILDSNIFVTLVFESTEQKNKVLKDLDVFRYGEMYLDGYKFAKAAGINIKEKTLLPRKKVKQEKGFNFQQMTFGDHGLDFGNYGENKKKEVGAVLKKIREDEKKLSDYLEWVSSAGYWVDLCFFTEEDRQGFCDALGLQMERGTHLWCYDVAEKLGITLEPCPYKARLYSGRESKLEAISMPLPQIP